MRKVKIVSSAVVGNIVEYYDFGIYAAFTAKIGALFFPQHDALIQTILAFAVFALGFVARPVGGVIFGHIGDIVGRRTALSISIVGMAIATLCIAVLPSYAQIGLYAPALLVVTRLFQGICIGGEGAGSAIFVLEHLDGYRPGLMGSIVHASNVVGTLVAMLVGLLLTDIFGDNDWSWRYGFVLGGIIGLLGLYLRRHIAETPVFEKTQRLHKKIQFPFLYVLTHKWRQVSMVACLSGMTAAVAYMIRAYFNVFFLQFRGFSASESLIFTSFSLLSFIIAMPVFGWISDKTSYQKFLRGACWVLLIGILPVFYLLSSNNEVFIWLGLFLVGLLAAAVGASSYPYAVYNFSPMFRYSGVAISWNIGSALFSGTTPAIATYLAKEISLEAPAFYVMAVTSLFLIVTRFICKDKSAVVS